MDTYTTTKDILIPLISPLIAISTLILFIKHERAKINIQAEHILSQLVLGTEREVLSLREVYQIIGSLQKQGKPVEPERLALLMESAERLFAYSDDCDRVT